PDVGGDGVEGPGVVEEDHRDAGVAQLQLDVGGADRRVGEHHRRVERQDRLGVEVVRPGGDHRQVLRLRKTGRGVAPHDVVAQPEGEDDLGERAVEVHREDAAGVGDLDDLPVTGLDGDRQLRLHRVDRPDV